MSEQEERSILTLCLLAAFADGAKDDREREQVKRIADSLNPATAIDLPELYQDVLLKRRTLKEAAAALATPETRQLAYEMAVCVCDADGARGREEREFLESLRGVLAIESTPAQAFAEEADKIAEAPLEPAAVLPVPNPEAKSAELDRMILNYSILNGALELLPQSLASMAILPLQVKMVYRIGKIHGYELDRGHIKDFAATLGVGLTGQYVEQMARKLLGGFIKKLGGGMLAGIGKTAVGSAFAFATTYALGQVAKQYYASGRTMDVSRLKQTFSSLLKQGKGMQARYAGDMQQKAQTIDVTQLAGLVRGQ